MKNTILYIFLLLMVHQNTYAKDYYIDYSEDIKRAYQLILSLEIDKSKEVIDSIKATTPHNLATIHLENYSEFFTLFVNEDEKEFKRFKKNKSKRLKLLDDKLNDDDPFKRFVIAEIHLQWALARSKFGELFKAGREILNAYQLLESNKEAHPNFIYNYKSLSVIHSLIETVTIPGFMKSILGLKGSIETGLDEINFVLKEQQDFIFINEAEAIKTFILYYQLNQKEEAWEYLSKSQLMELQNPLSVFLVSKIAQRSGRNDYAIQILDQRTISPTALPFHYLELQLGISKLRALNPKARDHIENFIREFDGLHYVKEAYQKLAWSYIIFENDFEKYSSIMNHMSSKGESLVDDDKQVVEEFKSKSVISKSLLETRLLYDGGYYNQALKILEKEGHQLNQDIIHQVEFRYRKARTLQALNNFDEAISQYEYLMKYQEKIESFYKCQSALQMGLIYEKLEEFNKAEEQFRVCLKIKSNKYKRSLHQKAKSGLERVEGNR